MKNVSSVFSWLAMIGLVYSVCPVMAQNTTNAVVHVPTNAVTHPVYPSTGPVAAVAPVSDPLLSFKQRAADVLDDSFYSLYIAQQLEIGTRLMQFVLLENSRGQPFNGSFVGSITKLNDNQDYLPTRIFVQYKLLPCLGVGLSYDQLSVATMENDRSTDGDCVISGPLLYLLGSYPNETEFTPFCELGVAFYSAKFDKSPGWGRVPGKDFLLDNPTGFYLAAGCDWLVTDNISVDLYGRYMNVDVRGVYTRNWEKEEDILFTLSSLSFGLGAKYKF